MDVDDAVGELGNEVFGYFGEETGEDDVVATGDGVEDELGVIVELLTGDDGGGYAEALGADEGVGVATAADDDGDLDVGAGLEVADDVFAVGAASGDEDGEANGVGRCHGVGGWMGYGGGETAVRKLRGKEGERG